MSRLRSATRRSVASVRRNARDLLAIAGASSIALGIASSPLPWLAWGWIGGFLLFAAGAGRRAA
jgi:hypothetical protein